MQSNRLKDNVTPFDVKSIGPTKNPLTNSVHSPNDQELYRLIGRDLDWERRSWSIFNKKKK